MKELVIKQKKILQIDSNYEKEEKHLKKII